MLYYVSVKEHRRCWWTHHIVCEYTKIAGNIKVKKNMQYGIETYTWEEILHIEDQTGLQFAGYLAMERCLFPIFVRPTRTHEEKVARVMRINNREYHVPNDDTHETV